MRIPSSTISRDIILDGAAVPVFKIPSGLSVLVDLASGSVHIEVSADGVTFVRVAHSISGQISIDLAPCHALRIVTATAAVVNTLQWSGPFR